MTWGTLALTAAVALAPFKVTSVQLWNEYRADAVKAEAKYRDKRVQIKGKVVWISAQYTVYLEGGKGWTEGVTCVPGDGHIVDMGPMVKGQIVNMECTCLGLVFNEPILNKCEVKP